MYLWRGPGYRADNGGDDASILYHEYTHGLEPAGIRRRGRRGRAELGPGGRDGRGLERLVRQGLPRPAVPGARQPGRRRDVHMGDYMDRHAIRSARGASTARSPAPRLPAPLLRAPAYTYGDFGDIAQRARRSTTTARSGQQTLWDLRDALGSSPAPALWPREGLRLSPAEPPFLDQRNAIRHADKAAGGARRQQIWSVFANRGMGFFATTVDASDADTGRGQLDPAAAGRPARRRRRTP